MAAAAASNDPQTIVLIHGMWMTPLSWEHWAERYRGRGHEVLTPAWPGLDREPEELRRDPSPLHGLSITDVVDSHDEIVRGLGRPPILIGHSFGGLVTQLLLDRGLGSAGVALGTATPKGVFPLPLSTLRAGWPALRNPFGRDGDVPLSRDQFHWCFTNALSRRDSDAVYDRYYVPGSARPFFQAAYPGSATKVSFANPQRAPLLLLTGTLDRICPASLNEANWKKQRQAPAATEHQEYPGRCHYPGQDGWEQVADRALDWATANARAA
ncbi:MAG TPA: alpha/beta fold hydrolase [Gaiellaceae bacterium]|nr:alpha/beta fold hydrolase [Gaiellaceae bacterium]